MEVQVGIVNSVREISLEIEGDEKKVTAIVEEALLGKPVLSGKDKKDRTVLIPTSAISHVIVGEAEERRVGFGL